MTRYGIVVFAVVLLLFISQVHAALRVEGDLENRGRVIALTDDKDARGVADPPWPSENHPKRSARMPDMVVLSDTEWLVIYDEYGSPFSTADWSRIVLKRTTDAGKTWTTQIINEQKKTDPNFLGNWNMSRISKLPDGRLVITSCVRYKTPCYLIFSSDNGHSWSEPIVSGITEIASKRFGTAISYVESSRIEALGDGTLILMAHRGALGKRPADNPKMNVIDVFASTDNAKTWSYRSTVKDESYSLCEPAILVDGQQLQIYCRDNRHRGPSDESGSVVCGMVVLRSEDGGRSWKKVYVADEAPGHQVGICRLKDGRVLAIHRRADTKKVSCEVWVHDPKTFKGKVFTLHSIPKANSIYKIDTGAAAQLSDGTILLCYSSFRWDHKTYWHYPDKRVRLTIMPPVSEWCPTSLETADSRR